MWYRELTPRALSMPGKIVEPELVGGEHQYPQDLGKKTFSISRVYTMRLSGIFKKGGVEQWLSTLTCPVSRDKLENPTY